MPQDTCRNYGCKNPVGEADRDDYLTRRYCSPRCEVKHEHIKTDAEAP